MKLLEATEFLSKLSKEKKGPEFISLTVKTVPEMRKGGNPFIGRVFKVNTLNCQINGIYQNAVNNAREKEGSERTFEAAPLKWGMHVPDSPFIVHTKKGESKPSFYLQTRVLHSSTPDYYLDGKFIESLPLRDQVISFIPGKSQNCETQGVSGENEVIIRTFRLDSIMQMKYRGETYIID